MYVCMYACMYVCMYVYTLCMYIYKYIYIHIYSAFFYLFLFYCWSKVLCCFSYQYLLAPYDLMIHLPSCFIIVFVFFIVC